MILLLVAIIWIIYTLINRYKAGKQQQQATRSTDPTPRPTTRLPSPAQPIQSTSIPEADPITKPSPTPKSSAATLRGERLRKAGDSGQEESIQPRTQQKTSSAPEKPVGQVNTVNVSKSVIKPAEKIGTIPVQSPEYNVDILTAQFVGYAPVSSFGQSEPLVYPLTVVPKTGCVVKFPKKGRFSNRGYKEPAFELFLKTYFGKQFDVLTEHHLLVSNGSNPYEPDFSLIDRKNGLNMCIDVEIDEPYSGLSRSPMHCQGDDALRNAFFTDRGWIVVRFAEIQVHQNPEGCCRYLADVIEAMHPTFRAFGLEQTLSIQSVDTWSSLQAQKWSAARYRELYLGIDGFGNISDLGGKLVPEEDEADRTAEENVISSVKVVFPHEKPRHWNVTNQHSRDKRLSFDEKLHQYWIDKNPNTVAVSTLINRMFPDFDEEYWAAKKAPQLGLTKEGVLQMWRANGEESRQLGTKLHADIENHYEHGIQVASKEFQQFLAFRSDHKELTPYRTEWRIFDDYHMIAGTADMVVKNASGGFDLYDWKRSKEIKTDGWGKVGFGPLSHIADCNYMHYSLQLNLYRWILKAHYDLEIDSMYLVVMHPNFDAYKKILVRNMEQDISTLLESTLFKC